MGLADRVAGAEPGGNYRYFGPGKCRAEITEVSIVDTRKQVELFAVSFEILENPEMVDNNGSALSEGDRVSWTVKTSIDGADGIIKSFLMKVMQKTKDELSPKDVGDSYSEAQPLSGISLDLVGFNKPKKDGSAFTVVEFSLVD